MNTIVASTDQVAEAMAALSTRSQKVGEIVTAISKIAEQTNLLALNAAIEAARAGEHGRGFTVVAEQIRALAESTQKETIQISQLIAGIQKEIQKATESIAQEVREVKKGSNVIDRAQTVFSEIIESIQKLAADMTFIADSSRQIANSSQQIAAATEEQTASVEEIAASADELRSLAEKLSQLSSRFKLE
jgi:methyl-accepting chemotaxis protein